MYKTDVEDAETDKWELKVVSALTRLQKEKGFLDACGKPIGIDIKQIVEYVSSHNCNLDGDIESQVITTLVASIKKGIICVLKSGKYHVVGPQSKPAVSNCVTRVRHGPQCGCLNMVNYLSTTTPSTCCYVKSAHLNKKKCKKPLLSDHCFGRRRSIKKPCDRKFSLKLFKRSLSCSPTSSPAPMSSSSSPSPAPSSCNKCPKMSTRSDVTLSRKDSQKGPSCWVCNPSGDNLDSSHEKFLTLKDRT